jgi:hypothetical protein
MPPKPAKSLKFLANIQRVGGVVRGRGETRATSSSDKKDTS